MKRILACLAALALPASANAAEPLSQGFDPIGDVLSTVQSAATTVETVAKNAFDWSMRVSLYHGGRHMGSRDALGCPVAPMRTVAIDPSIVARRSIIFIKETAGMPLPDGGVHDGYWYASDIGGAIKGSRIDLFTGLSAESMKPLAQFNMKAVTVVKVGEFGGCPPTDGGAGASAKAAYVEPPQDPPPHDETAAIPTPQLSIR